MAIVFSGKLNKSDVNGFIDILNHPINKIGKYIIPLWALLLYIGSGFGIAGLFLLFLKLWVGLFLIALAITIIIGSYICKKSQIKQLGELFDNSLPIQGEIDIDGIKIKSQLVNNSINWKAYTGYGEKGEYCILFENNVMVLYLKRSYFASEVDWKDALSIISQNIIKTHGRITGINKLELLNILPFIIVLVMAIYILLSK